MKSKSPQLTISDIIRTVIEQNTLFKSAMQLYPKQLIRAGITGTAAQTLSQTVDLLEKEFGKFEDAA